MRYKIQGFLWKDFAAFAVVCLMLPGCATRFDLLEKQMSADRTGTYGYSGNSVNYDGKALVVKATHLSKEETDGYYRALKGGRYANPLSEKLVVFLLEITNKGKAEAVFNPTYASLTDNVPGDTPAQVFDFDTAYMVFEKAGPDADGLIAAYKAACFGTQVGIPPGGKVVGLLVFIRPREFGGKAILNLDGVYIGSEPMSVPLLFKSGIDK
jgi:hypothetical protein